ncbi:uncharacterized protein Eint_051040 [Encephalitozoon intestinalis ATCC 50506]|uniref:Uncharacterized protein n=1 Tax=Encephalitozoon intestinalis (strain ATCC 50506) TaxID=876142 RepID=E0S7C3_ENCIT|nr:uncharacterized protein Eint_051040 [Encephalitozoon intestinalis ATCC 50506]ADM11551.1 hypothetical protein Eint_051040 [Encephalitozoon intestinalis ATCC 50506]UTX45265.1 ADP-ribosylation factor [Encephalitozoon intestinalis]
MDGVWGSIKRKLKDMYDRIFVVRMRVAVIGPEKSGKSSIVMKMFGDGLRYQGKQNDAEVYKYDEDYMSYVVYDLKGKKNTRRKWDYFHGMCDVILYCVDSSGDEEEWGEAREKLKSMVYRNLRSKKNILVLGTKNERGNALECIEIVLKLDLLDIEGREVACFSVSAEKNVNVECIKTWLRGQSSFVRSRWGSRVVRSWWKAGFVEN